VAVDGSENTSSTACASVLAFASLRAAPFSEAVRPSGAAGVLAAEGPPHGDERSAPGVVPTTADPSRHDVPPGLVPFAPAPDDAVNVEGVAPAGPLQAVLISPVAGTPAEESATRHADPDGAPAAPVPSAPLTEKSSDAVDGPLPHVVPTLASVGTPGDASAVLHVDA
jgi:hypothetical protein